MVNQGHILNRSLIRPGPDFLNISSSGQKRYPEAKITDMLLSETSGNDVRTDGKITGCQNIGIQVVDIFLAQDIRFNLLMTHHSAPSPPARSTTVCPLTPPPAPYHPRPAPLTSPSCTPSTPSAP
ncbi:hypothetical protein Pcinc_017717 [Petrolisthes cinctipes]|uniref:Uncharacterized protein n=1 Tax=Petrolisthes cinctipes TaxID=88211 RepID=A0AAE1KPL0_PETCI|nr:hypothetical protein Pcinc_017717 [Petrolisthes cinctipes]